MEKSRVDVAVDLANGGGLEYEFIGEVSEDLHCGICTKVGVYKDVYHLFQSVYNTLQKLVLIYV